MTMSSQQQGGNAWEAEEPDNRVNQGLDVCDVGAALASAPTITRRHVTYVLSRCWASMIEHVGDFDTYLEAREAGLRFHGRRGIHMRIKRQSV